MNTTFFKTIGQQTAGKLIIVSVVPIDIFGKVPSIFEMQSLLMPKTIYTGTYPTIKVNTDTLKDITPEMKGKGIDGIITSAEWYIQTNNQKDILGIGI